MKKFSSKAIIKEFIQQIVENELNKIPTKAFSFEELLKYVSNEKRIGYLEDTLKYLGAGSSRIVFELDSTKVIKVAYQDIGQEQNKKEWEFSKNPKLSNVLTKVFEPYEEEFIWIIAEKVKPIKYESELENFFGVSWKFAEELFKNICYLGKTKEELKKWFEEQLNYFNGLQQKHNQSIEDEHQRRTEKAKQKGLPIPNKLVRTFIHATNKQNYEQFDNIKQTFFDICEAIPEMENNANDMRPGQFGITKDNRLVLLDYGFGNDVSSFYNNPYRIAYEAEKSERDMGDYQEFDEPQEDEYGNKIIKKALPLNKPSNLQIINHHDDEGNIPF